MSEPTTAWLQDLQSTYPTPSLDLDAGWADVLRRADAPRGADVLRGAEGVQLTGASFEDAHATPIRRSHRRLGIALAAVSTLLLSFATLAAAAAIIGGPLAGFRDWLGIGPGKPAPPAAQRSFSKANAASVARFPSGTKLRLLLGGRIGASRYRLLGFRAPGRLCLRLELDGVGSAPACTPLAALTARGELVHVLVAGQPLSGVAVTYGLATDAVRRVELVDRRGAHPAQLADDAFLYVSQDGERPLGAIAVDAAGDEVPIAVPATAGAVGPQAGWGFQRTPRLRDEAAPPKGRRPQSGTLSWLLQRKPLGAPLPSAKILPLLPSGTHLLFARLVSPGGSPLRAGQGSPLKVGVALVRRGGTREVCEILYQPLSDGLAGCAPVASLFARHDIVGRMLPSVAGGEGAVLVGLAAPSVSQIGALADERKVEVAPRHGVFAIAHQGSSFSPWLFVSERTPARPPSKGRRWDETEVEYGRWPAPRSNSQNR